MEVDKILLPESIKEKKSNYFFLHKKFEVLKKEKNRLDDVKHVLDRKYVHISFKHDSKRPKKNINKQK